MLRGIRVIRSKTTIRCECGRIFQTGDNCGTRCPKCGKQYKVVDGIVY